MCVTLKTNLDSVVGIVIRLWAAKQRSHGSIPGRGKRERVFSLLQSVQRPSESPMQCVCVCVYVYIYRVSRGECARLRDNIPLAKVHRYNPKHLYPKLYGYGDNG